MALNADDVKRIKLETALSGAPRPQPEPNAKWVIAYMDWYFQTRINALENK